MPWIHGPRIWAPTFAPTKRRCGPATTSSKATRPRPKSLSRWRTTCSLNTWCNSSTWACRPGSGTSPRPRSASDNPSRSGGNDNQSRERQGAVAGPLSDNQSRDRRERWQDSDNQSRDRRERWQDRSLPLAALLVSPSQFRELKAISAVQNERGKWHVRLVPPALAPLRPDLGAGGGRCGGRNRSGTARTAVRRQNRRPLPDSSGEPEANRRCRQVPHQEG